jgi:hypothetical protein
MFTYERESRTPSSESYVVENEQGSRARADLHFTPTIVYATLCVPSDWAEDDIHHAIADLDDRVVRSADPLRQDFIVTVWAGAEAGVYSDEESVSDFADANHTLTGARAVGLPR